MVNKVQRSGQEEVHCFWPREEACGGGFPEILRLLRDVARPRERRRVGSSVIMAEDRGRLRSLQKAAIFVG